jgi:hypothetical protein
VYEALSYERGATREEREREETRSEKQKIVCERGARERRCERERGARERR